MNNKLLIAAAVSAALSPWQASAQASTPTISWEPQSYSFVKVNLDGRGSYKDLVQASDEVQISIKWNAWSGTGGTSYKVYFDDEVVNEGPVPQGANSGTITFPYTKSGRHNLTIALCDADGCAKSSGKSIVIADTDGSHLAPLTMNVDPNNKQYDKKENTVVGSYFVEWGIYGRNFDVSQIPADNLTHLLYGFIPICGPNESLKSIENGASWNALQTACAGSQDYEVVIHDPWAAIQKALPGTASSEPIRGTYAQLMALKQRNPDLKILPSVGGWTLSDPFFEFTEKANRDVFVASMREFLTTWKFYDGIDIDWEFPGGDGASPTLGDRDKDGPAYVALMQELRAMLDELSAETGRTYELTSAIGMGYDKIEDVNYANAAQYLDYIFAMTYDYFGGWNNITGHQTALYCGEHMSAGECDGTGVDEKGVARKGPAYTSDNGVQALLQQGVDPQKIVLGAAMYGRGWEGVYPQNATIPNNPMSAIASGPLQGTQAQYVWEPGIQDYKGIKEFKIGPNGTGINGFELGYDEQAQAAYAWNKTTGTLIGYDNDRSVKAKGQYVRDLNLGGLFSWVIDADNGDILNAMHEGLENGAAPVNHKPVVSISANQSVNGGDSVVVSATATDSDNDSLTYTWTIPAAISQANGAIDLTNPTLNFTAPNAIQDTNYVLTVAVSDGKATVNKQTTVTVIAPVNENTAPEVADIANVSVTEGQSVGVDVIASDKEGDSLTYTWQVPSELTLQGSGANVTLLAKDVAQTTSVAVSVVVSDGKLSTTKQFLVTIVNVEEENSAPTINAIANIVMDENQSVSVSASAQDADNDALTYQWSVSSTNGLSVIGNGANASLVAGEVSQDSNFVVTVVVSDGQAHASTSFTVTVNNKSSNNGGDTTWSADTIYVGGDKVKFNGVEYKAKWWTKGNQPDAGDPWEEIIPDDGKVRAWSANRIYVGGDQATFNGELYQAKWWTQGNQPGTNDVWTKL